MKSFAWRRLAAFAEIGGCFAFWACLRLNKRAALLIPGMLSLALFAYALTKIQSSHAGRAYAAYGGVYILSSLIWLWAVDSTRPVGSFGPRSASLDRSSSTKGGKSRQGR